MDTKEVDLLENPLPHFEGAVRKSFAALLASGFVVAETGLAPPDMWVILQRGRVDVEVNFEWASGVSVVFARRGFFGRVAERRGMQDLRALSVLPDLGSDEYEPRLIEQLLHRAADVVLRHGAKALEGDFSIFHGTQG